MKENLCIISTRNPTKILLDCISQVEMLFDTFDIVVVDSNSDNRTILNELNYPIISGNSNYEFGAYKLGYESNKSYKNYMCIQDSFIPIKKIDSLNEISDQISMVNKYEIGFSTHTGIINCAKDLVDKTTYSELFSKICNTKFMIDLNCSFIVSNNTIKNIIDTLPNLPINKDGSCSYERIFGIFFLYHNHEIIDINGYFQKIQLGRS